MKAPPDRYHRGLALDALLATLLPTFVATWLSTRWPDAPGGLAIGLDLVPFVGTALASWLVAARLRRVAGPGWRRLVLAFGFPSGAVVASLGVAHITAVATFVDAYTFRTYSLFLLGALLLAAGSTAALLAPGQALGSRGAARAAFCTWSFILLVNVPLVPLQGFAAAFSALALANLILIVVLRKDSAEGPHAGGR